MNVGLELKRPQRNYYALGFVFDTSQPKAFAVALALIVFTIGVKVDWSGLGQKA